MADQTFAVNCGFFDAVDGDRTYSADQMNNPYKRLISNGVFATPQGTPSTDLQVSGTGSMAVTVAVGQGIFADKWFNNPTILTITVPSNTGIVPRMDSVLVQVDKRQSGRVGNIVYRTGSPSSNPTPPSINQVENVTEYRLANVYVAAGANAINNDAITDMRGSSSCPWVTSLVYQVDTSVLFQQWQAAYQNFYDESTEDYDQYVAEQQSNWEAFLQGLTEDLTVNTNIIMLTSQYVAQSSVSTVPIGIASYNKETDVLQVYINGLRAMEGNQYTVNSAGTSIVLKSSLSAGQTVQFTVFKSVITGDLSTVQNLIQALENKLARITSDSGWINFTLESGASAFNTSMKPAVRCVGDRVYLRGAFKGVTTLGSTICTLPVAYRPAMAHTWTTAAVNGTSVADTVVMQITTQGYVKLLASSGALSGSHMISLATDFVLENLQASEASTDAGLAVTDDGNGNVILAHT